MNITITTTTENLQNLETLLWDYERLLTDHCYAMYAPEELKKITDRIMTINMELDSLISQAERQILAQ